MNARETNTGILVFFKVRERFSVRLAIALLSFAAIAGAQISAPTNANDGSTEIENASSPQKAQDSASQNATKPGSIVGTILDQEGTVGAGAVVRLSSQDGSFSREVESGNNGQFSFSNVPPGPFKISVSAEGFGNQEFAGELASGQTFLVPAIVISIATVVTAVDVKVSVDPVEVATEEIKIQEQQRVLGFIPNFYVSYKQDAAPLTTKLKFQLACIRWGRGS